MSEPNLTDIEVLRFMKLSMKTKNLKILNIRLSRATT